MRIWGSKLPHVEQEVLWESGEEVIIYGSIKKTFEELKSGVKSWSEITREDRQSSCGGSARFIKADWKSSRAFPFSEGGVQVFLE